MSGIAAATVGGAILSAHIQGNAASDAASTQARAAREASGVQLQIHNQNRADQEPWRNAGVKALGEMQNPDFMKDFSSQDFKTDPGYQFRMAEGQKALERSAAARGGLMGGGTLKAISRYGQDVASQEYQNVYNRFNADGDRRFNRLSALAGTGQTATAQMAHSGTNYANQTGQNMMGAANAQAAGTMGAANATSGAIGQGVNNWTQYQLMNRMFPKTDGTGGGSGAGGTGGMKQY